MEASSRSLLVQDVYQGSKSITVAVRPGMTIRDVKLAVEQLHADRPTPSAQRLIGKGRELTSDTVAAFSLFSVRCFVLAV